ncbi:GMC family oxidoreductase [Pseudonocardia sp. CA-107938]|uniref:GMC family oxidoreductase n=1 Tax=Pseudonocardia sp. CA-107938 TaxID=3240021 RepID=UPI003D8E4CC3
MSFDYIIVGGGTAGSVLAHRLTETPGIQVLLLEAGSRDLNPMIHVPGGVGMLFGPSVNWRFKTVPQPELDNREIWYPQGKTLGGSSSINAMIYIRGQREDYDHWAELGNKGWAYDDVLPYFTRSEDNSRLVDRYHGQGGPQAVSDQTNPHELSTSFVRAAQSWGLPYNPDFNGETMAGAGLYQVTARAGFRRSQATSFLRPARRRPGLTVRTGARVLRIVVDRGRAIGVVVADRRGRTQVIRAQREVLLASGAINTPRLLMLSGIGAPDELAAVGLDPVHALPAVGKNLMDHLNTNVHALTREPISYDGLDEFPRLLGPGLRWLLWRTGPAASVIVEGGGFFTSPGQTRPDMQIHIAPATVVRGGQTRLPGNGFTINSTYLRPESRGTVSLRSADPAVPPAIDPRYLSAGRDREMALHLIRTIREVLAQPDMARHIEQERLPGAHAKSDEDIMAYVRQYASCDYHPVGTCRMGDGPDSVVDANLRVHGLDGLRVIDASIMPKLVSGNTMAPTMMIAEKGADLVKSSM